MAPTLGSTPAERFLALSIAGARERLYITNAYFAPDKNFMALLVRAARRGVDVRLTIGALWRLSFGRITTINRHFREGQSC